MIEKKFQVATDPWADLQPNAGPRNNYNSSSDSDSGQNDLRILLRFHYEVFTYSHGKLIFNFMKEIRDFHLFVKRAEKH